MEHVLPGFIQKYFWGDDLEELEWEKHKKYIMQVILDRGDKEALKWLFDRVSTEDLNKVLLSLKLSAKSRNFWQLYLSKI